MKKLVEFFKSILIVVLMLAVIALFVFSLPTKTLTAAPRLAAALRPFAGVLGISEAELMDTAPAAAAQITAAAQPIAISVNTSAGRQSFLGDFSALDAAYEQLGSLLGQALDSAGDGVATDEAALMAALSGQSVLLRYAGSVPAAALGAWLHTAAPQGQASDFILALDGSQVVLYLVGETALRYPTAADAAEFSDALTRYAPDGSRLAFEEEGAEYAALQPFSLLPAEPPRMPAAAVSNPCDTRFVSALASSLGFNPYGDARYVDDGGNTAFTEPGRSLTISAAGEVQLRMTEDSRFACVDDTCAGQIETARALLSTMTESVFGAARLYLTGYEPTESGAVCRFDYCLEGLPAPSGATSAAEVTLADGAVTFLRMTVRRFTPAGEPVPLLPAAQAAAIAQPGAALHLVYTDGGDGTVTPSWAAQ